MSILSSKPTITRKELEGVLDCLMQEELIKGDIIKILESRVSELTGVKYALTANSLTSAYHLAFLSLGIGSPSDEVVMPSYFDLAPLSALRLAGGTPILVDVEEGTLAPTLEQIREKVTERTKAIVIGHTFGFHMNVEELREYKIPVIEDISHVIGSEINEAPAGQIGTITLASFSPAMMITTGNGAIALTNNSRFYSSMRELRGSNERDNVVSFDYGMTDFQGAMGISQIMKLTDFIRRRRDIARTYYEALKMTPHRTPYAYSETFTYQSFPVLFDAPVDKVEKFWKKAGVDIRRPISTPLHGYLNLKNMDYPQSDRYAKKLYSLPIYPTLTKKEIEKISKTLASFV